MNVGVTMQVDVTTVLDYSGEDKVEDVREVHLYLPCHSRALARTSPTLRASYWCSYPHPFPPRPSMTWQLVLRSCNMRSFDGDVAGHLVRLEVLSLSHNCFKELAAFEHFENLLEVTHKGECLYFASLAY